MFVSSPYRIMQTQRHLLQADMAATLITYVPKQMSADPQGSWSHGAHYVLAHDMEGFNGSEVPNTDLVFQIYNLLQLMTYSSVIGKPLSHFHDDHT